jgi:[glutamine synthetase] adenylyltransferase / [glutamine synthetase]-adenylyl-L-tyrosine phosphorylase
MPTLSDRLQQPFPKGDDAHATRHFWSSLSDAEQAGLGEHKALIDGVVSGSPYLAGLLRQHLGFAVACLASDPHTTLNALCDSVASADADGMAAHLRLVKARFALFCGLCDLGNVWSLDDVTSALTRFADACVNVVVNHLLSEAHRSGRYVLPTPHEPAKGCSYVVQAWCR